MLIILSLALAIAPALYLARYYYLKDQERPEPKKLIIDIFFLGFIYTIPVAFIEAILLHFYPSPTASPFLFCFFKAFVVAACCEEYLKLAIVKRYAYHNKNFDEVMDGIVYAIIASMGFACLENILYVLNRGIGVAFLRAITAVPMHALCSGMMGYYIGLAKFSETKSKEKKYILKGLLIAIAIHGSYDFAIFANQLLLPGIALAIFPLIFWNYRKLKTLISKAKALDYERHSLKDQTIIME